MARGLVIRVGREPASRRRADAADSESPCGSPVRSRAGPGPPRSSLDEPPGSPGDQQPGAEARSARRLLSSSLGVRQRAKACPARRRRRIGSRARRRGQLTPHVRGRVRALGWRRAGVRTDLAALARPTRSGRCAHVAPPWRRDSKGQLRSCLGDFATQSKSRRLRYTKRNVEANASKANFNPIAPAASAILR